MLSVCVCVCYCVVAFWPIDRQTNDSNSKIYFYNCWHTFSFHIKEVEEQKKKKKKHTHAAEV